MLHTHCRSRNHYVGAASEYAAAAYFLRQGYQVYWPSCQHTEVDFVIESPSGRLKKVQVKTGTWVQRSDCSYRQLQVPAKRKPQDSTLSDRYDLLCAVDGSDIWVIPSKKIEKSTVILASSSASRINRRWKRFKVN